MDRPLQKALWGIPRVLFAASGENDGESDLEDDDIDSIHPEGIPDTQNLPTQLGIPLPSLPRSNPSPNTLENEVTSQVNEVHTNALVATTAPANLSLTPELNQRAQPMLSYDTDPSQSTSNGIPQETTENNLEHSTTPSVQESDSTAGGSTN
ncbi:hypothetical protein RSOLAG22IIIB_02876 [Rhizoctonia solani]|uniref:Uncharacterized protein n=1 Tax=Rhizoctonia solani TaxID=456999 RepID=A0A0K6FLE0_9AGAM|nr:hypothetical protein RSOLAG22IIIB_02876 [Rhizoctonia solani]